MKKQKHNFIYYIPRIFSIVFILFISVFALDAGSILGFIIHLIPSYVYIFALIIAWKDSMRGSIFFSVLGFGTLIFFKTYANSISFLILTFPTFCIGLLFYLDYIKNKVKNKKQKHL